jgi:hypothetical protein
MVVIRRVVSLVGQRCDFLKKIRCRAVDVARALAQLHERHQSVWQASLELLIREAGEASKVPPIRTRRVAAEALRQILGCTGTRFAIKNLPMVEPRLKVPRRGFDDQRGRESFALHGIDRFSAQIVDETERMRAVGPDKDVRTMDAFLAQRFDRGQDQRGAAILAEHHPVVRA